MKILMLYPNLDAPFGTNHGIAALAGVLKAHGHEFELWHVCEKYRPVPTSAEILEHVRATAPDLIGFSVLSQQYDWACEKSRDLRRALPDLPQVIGGVHCTMVPDEVHRSRLFDYVCVGEGEYALLALMDALERGEPTDRIPNLRLWKGDEPVVNPVAPFPDLKTLPRLDYDVFDMEAVLAHTRGWMGILTSRGCPYKCTYCFNLEIVDQYVQDGAARGVKEFLRFFPIDTMMQELQDLTRRYPQIRTFIFDDDLFTLNRKYVQDFCAAYRAAGVGRPFVVNGHVQCFDAGSARALKEAGCRIVKFGLESGSDRVRREVLHRFMTNDDIVRSFEAAHAYDLHTSAFVMFGLPHETRDEILETLDLCAKVKMGRFRWAIFFPFPGTAGYEIAKPLIDESRMHGLGNYFDGSCLRFGEEHDLFLAKLGKLCNWWVNARSDWPCAPIYQELVAEVEAMDRATFERRKDELVAYDRELSDELMAKDLTHYAIRYSNVMGVRSDFIRWEQEEMEGRPDVEAVTYTLDQS
ncbi:MAG TPA: radical SAM protein [Candidatus Polarisedimenticolia bacterium]|nr:radical SAM protein [Candidatus Polarisedimenticolia bacterium]